MINEARQLGLFAAEMSAKHADVVNENWTADAYSLFVKFSNENNRPFLTEEVRAYAEGQGLPSPPDGRAWGHIAKSCDRNKVIKSIGYSAAKSSNGSPKVLWRKR
jgi:hypothetical protein